MEYQDVGGLKIPQVGLGLYSMRNEELTLSLKSAVESGYSLYDTAYRYNNEKEIGSFFSSSVVRNDTNIICTKISGLQYNGHRHFLYLDKQSIKKSVTNAAKKLKRKQIDILLLHSPFAGYQQAYKELWLAQQEGLAKVIGVSGFSIEQLESIKDNCKILPQVCMLEIHPYHSSSKIVDYCYKNGIQVIARSPFAHGEIFEELKHEDAMIDIMTKTKKSVPQIILRWCVQHGWIAIPRSSNKNHIIENISIFDFALTDNDMRAIDSLNKNKSYGVFMVATS